MGDWPGCTSITEPMKPVARARISALKPATTAMAMSMMAMLRQTDTHAMVLLVRLSLPSPSDNFDAINRSALTSRHARRDRASIIRMQR